MQRRTRVLGPYPDRKQGGWRLVISDLMGGRSYRRCATEAEALQRLAEIEATLEHEAPLTVEKALDQYEAAQREGGRKESTIGTTMQRLRSLHALVPGSLRRLGAAEAAAAYRAYAARLGPGAKTISADTHRNALSQAKTFGKWCVKQGWAKNNPWAQVEPMGRKRRGKVQLRVDEARAFQAKALELAAAGDESAVAALCCLLLGPRSSEVVERVGRDVDDGGALLWIDRSKTEAGRRTVVVPEMLRPFLVHLQGIRAGGVRLFDGDRHWLYYHVRRICRLAGVTIVCPHGLRGTHASLAMTAGASSQLVASSLGHASPAVTLAHYAKPEAVASGQADRAWKVLAGGER